MSAVSSKIKTIRRKEEAMFRVIGSQTELSFDTMEEAIEAIEMGRIDNYPEDVIILTPTEEVIVGAWAI
jgi:hypothetical protein